MQTHSTLTQHAPQTVLANLVDELGTLRAQKKAIEAREEELTTALTPILQSIGGKGHGEHYHAQHVPGERLNVDAELYAQAVPFESLLQSVSVSVTKARKFLGEDTIRAISAIEPTQAIRVSEAR